MCCGNICLVKQGKYIGTVTEGPEYRGGHRIFEYPPFGVPLDSQRESGRLANGEGLDQPVVRHVFHFEFPGEPVDTL